MYGHVWKRRHLVYLQMSWFNLKISLISQIKQDPWVCPEIGTVFLPNLILRPVFWENQIWLWKWYLPPCHMPKILDPKKWASWGYHMTMVKPQFPACSLIVSLQRKINKDFFLWFIPNAALKPGVVYFKKKRLWHYSAFEQFFLFKVCLIQSCSTW
jgi:hypothetical protein